MNLDNKRDYNTLRPVKQYFEWGNVAWLHEPENQEKGKLLVGHVTFLPHKDQGKHLHTGDEQILYTISGRGEQWVDGSYHPLVPGTIHHIPPYAEHNVRNISDEALEMIIVYNINSINYDTILPHVDFSRYFSNKSLRDIIDLNILQQIQDKFSRAVDLAIIIKDEKGEVLTVSSNIPDFCRIRCEMGWDCKLKGNFIPSKLQEHTVTSCCFDLISISTPIFFSDQYIGSIFCGPAILNKPSDSVLLEMENGQREYYSRDLIDAYLKIRKITKGRLYAIIESLKTISSYIVELGINNLSHQELHKKTLQVLEETQTRIQLEKALTEARMKVIQAQISPHFLFNTLSIIGELAYMKGAKDAADTTFALSNLLRTSLKKSQEMISVREEIKYIQDYIFIQQKRFGNLIKTEISVDPNIIDFKIPFMTLQTLVENAIVHGLETSSDKGVLKIGGRFENESMIFEVMDNGKGICPEDMNNILNTGGVNSHRGTGIGLNNLRERLAYYYGDEYVFSIESQEKRGTRVRLVLPVKNRRVDLFE